MPCDESVPLQRGSEGSLPTPALSSYSGDGEYDGYGDGYRDGYGDGYGDGSEFRASPHSRTPVQNLPAPLSLSSRTRFDSAGAAGPGGREPDSELAGDSVAFCQPSHAVCTVHTGGGDDGGGGGLGGGDGGDGGAGDGGDGGAGDGRQSQRSKH